METTTKVSNRLTALFQNKSNNLLNIYFTAGYPTLHDTVTVLKALEKAGVDMVEIGMPYSDPVADGPVIQQSSLDAINNGMTIKTLLQQLKDIRKEVTIPILLMGYFNTVMQYGVEKFMKEISEIGIDGVILPDLPLDEYIEHYQSICESNNISNVSLITPNTSDERLLVIDNITQGFIYMVSTNSTTGNDAKKTEDNHDAYFSRIKNMGLKSPRMIGFNIKDHKTFTDACTYANGAIIGSAFVRLLAQSKHLERDILTFVSEIRK
ncbi:tryptophan synthase subunit alpha [Cytophaga hutchinsonii]|uniref:Tryptophan synthase alpha chain n=1 Tax=Cytophaga hutchinsonii (strain ATCC 33406 / DSM 1761 / CIP 103989 / NBRC 15051 / NCIMB 9469 / D465) TaxID=269798 RepID=A0A6N4SW38_CYTH3|nr:tryptophan synthase subunit alpha [Cytophaga hutchinsonii]ABG60536.1 tryptophan synthase, alpha chain [Cytophaga hutchinsonii ATCC 33406]SFX90558.1 tryptophan synthase, alpha chain [Cytophaga hutchinsonii ATCC 33406]